MPTLFLFQHMQKMVSSLCHTGIDKHSSPELQPYLALLNHPLVEWINSLASPLIWQCFDGETSAISTTLEPARQAESLAHLCSTESKQKIPSLSCVGFDVLSLISFRYEHALCPPLSFPFNSSLMSHTLTFCPSQTLSKFGPSRRLSERHWKHSSSYWIITALWWISPACSLPRYALWDLKICLPYRNSQCT